MRLATPEEVVLATGVASNAGSLDNARRALDSSLHDTENFLETVFSEQSVTDYFSPTDTSTVYRLSRMLIAEDTLVVRVSPTTDPLLTEADGDLVPATDYFLNAEKGLLTFRDTLYPAPHTLSVSFDSGLALDSATKVYKGVPRWLAEAAISAAVAALNVTPFNQANRKEKNVATVAKTLTARLYQALAPHFRPRMLVEMPVRTVVHE